MKDVLKALLGLALVFVVHIPRAIFLGLLISYAAVFANRPTLTADPAEHLRRARKILRRGRLSELLYAAVEIRFALERMVQRELIWAEASARMLSEYDPTKKIANLHRLAPEAAFAQEIWFVNKITGQRIKWGEYKPLDQRMVKQLQGRLGDLLHPKDGLLLGVPADPWYVETRRFLDEALGYLQQVHQENRPFFSYNGVPYFEMVRASKQQGV
jgi:hypothetical protein